MGIIADTMAEVVERTQNTMEGALTDLRTADSIELVTDGTKVWVNVDGICALRIQSCTSVIMPTGRMAGATMEAIADNEAE